MASEFARIEWQGKRVRVTFKRHWPVRIGNYVYDGFTDDYIIVTHVDTGRQRNIIWYDIENVELA